MYLNLSKKIISTRRQLKAAQREFKDVLDRQRFSNPDMTNWQVARQHARTIQRLQRMPYRRYLGMVMETDSPASKLWIRHYYRHILRRIDQEGPYAPSAALEKSIRWQADDGVVRRVVGAVSGDAAVLMQIRVDGAMVPLLKMSPHGLAVIPTGPKGHVPPDVFLAEEVQEHPAGHVVTTYVKPIIVNESPKELRLGTIDNIVPPAPPTVLLGEIDKTTRLPNGMTYHGEPNVLVPPKGTVKDPTVLPPGLPYPTPQKLIHPAAAEAFEGKESKPGKIKVNGKYVRVVQRVVGGIVNLYKVNDDGSKEPLTGIIG